MTNRTEFVDEQERELVEAVKGVINHRLPPSFGGYEVAIDLMHRLEKAYDAYTPKPLDHSKPMPSWEDFRDMYSGDLVIGEAQYTAIRDAIAKDKE